jgi:hypothetical protein
MKHRSKMAVSSMQHHKSYSGRQETYKEGKFLCLRHDREKSNVILLTANRLFNMKTEECEEFDKHYSA